MRVFVLNTGRCGSMTTIKACEHLTNYTAGHETRTGAIGDRRLDYPDRHVEADNRLSWFLGILGERFGDGPLYVHLRRDPEEVAASFLRRWRSWRTSAAGSSVLGAFAHGLLIHHEEWGGDRTARRVPLLRANRDEEHRGLPGRQAQHHDRMARRREHLVSDAVGPDRWGRRPQCGDGRVWRTPQRGTQTVEGAGVTRLRRLEHDDVVGLQSAAPVHTPGVEDHRHRSREGGVVEIVVVGQHHGH